jgi:hypothetical protein
MFSCSDKKPQNKFWNLHVIDASFSGPDGVRLADVNNDGLLDVTTGWEEGGFTKVYINPGFERVKLPWPSVIAGKTPDVEDAVFSDLDGDGTLDVISCTEGKNRKIYINWAPEHPDDYLDSSKWSSEFITASDGMMQWMFAVPFQLDGKNGPDIIAGAKGSYAMLGWFQAPENPRHMTDWTWMPIGPATWIMSIILRDMDSDGDMDIVVSDRKPGATRGVRWLENPGTDLLEKGEPWANHFIGGQDAEVMFMDMADLDGDGLEDAICSDRDNQKIRFWRRLDESGLRWEEFQIDLPDDVGKAKSVKAGDIDGNGKLDIVLTTYPEGNATLEGVTWFSYRESPFETTWHRHHLGGMKGKKFDRTELIDIDGDGDLDVMTCEENYGPDSWGLGVIWYENPFGR